MEPLVQTKERKGCHPAAEPGAKIRPSRTAPRRAIVLILVQALLAVHIAHWVSSGSSLSPLEPSESMEFVKHGIINAGLIFFGLTILSTLVLGRWFCGWACHLVALQDLCLWILRKLGIRPKPMRSRLLAWVPTVAAVYMFVYPLAHRLWSGGGFPARQVVLTKQDFWATFPPWPVALVTFAMCGFATVYFLGAKGFCTYACPYGAIFGLAERFAVGRIRVTDACEGCAHCTATCTSNVIVHEEVRRYGMVVDPGCMKCGDCISVCPKNALYFGFGRPSLGTHAQPGKRSRFGYSLREELLLAAVFLAIFFAFRGLYGVIPFLLALAVAGLCAWAFVELARLVQRPSLSLGGRTLKQDGRLTRRGFAFVLVMLGISALTVHSALVQFHAARSATAFAGIASLREEFLVDPARRLRDGEPALASALSSARFVEHYGLLASPANDSQLAWFQLLTGEPSGFEQHLRSVLAADPGAESARYDLGRFLEARGRIPEAIAEYEASLTARPGASVFDHLARLYWATGNPEQALDVYRRATARFPDNPDLCFNLGVALAGLERFDEAAAAFRRVLELDPDRVEARENLESLPAATGSSRPPDER